MRWEGFKIVKIKFFDKNNFVQFKAKFQLLNIFTIRQIKMKNKTIYMGLSDHILNNFSLKIPKKIWLLGFCYGFYCL